MEVMTTPTQGDSWAGMRLHGKNFPYNGGHAVQHAISVVILVRDVISLISVFKGFTLQPRDSLLQALFG